MNEVATIPDRSVQQLSAAQMKAHVQVIQQVMQAVMIKDTHYGKIPGAGDRPTLFKAGSEVLLSTFRIAVDPKVEDLSTPDEVRFRVTAVGRHQTTDIVIGSGIGEASSMEEKYCWRAAVCIEEFNETPEDRRRTKWKKGERAPYQVKQVRTNPSDVANTVLKMAKKRAQIDMTLTALAASDCFTQDLEDLPEEMRDADRPAPKAEVKPPQAKAEATPGTVKKATGKQVELMKKKLDESGVPEEAFLKHFAVDAIDAVPFAQVDAALSWIRSAVGP